MKNKVYPVKYAKQSSISPFLKSHIESFPNAGPHPISLVCVVFGGSQTSVNSFSL